MLCELMRTMGKPITRLCMRYSHRHIAVAIQAGIGCVRVCARMHKCWTVQPMEREEWERRTSDRMKSFWFREKGKKPSFFRNVFKNTWIFGKSRRKKLKTSSQNRQRNSNATKKNWTVIKNIGLFYSIEQSCKSRRERERERDAVANVRERQWLKQKNVGKIRLLLTNEIREWHEWYGAWWKKSHLFFVRRGNNTWLSWTNDDGFVIRFAFFFWCDCCLEPMSSSENSIVLLVDSIKYHLFISIDWWNSHQHAVLFHFNRFADEITHIFIFSFERCKYRIWYNFFLSFWMLYSGVVKKKLLFSSKTGREQ